MLMGHRWRIACQHAQVLLATYRSWKLAWICCYVQIELCSIVRNTHLNDERYLTEEEIRKARAARNYKARVACSVKRHYNYDDNNNPQVVIVPHTDLNIWSLLFMTCFLCKGGWRFFVNVWFCVRFSLQHWFSISISGVPSGLYKWLWTHLNLQILDK
jgi:hypothetical protein